LYFHILMRENSLLYYVASVLRLALYPFTLIYGALVWLRNRLYDVKFFSSVGFSVPVISVGNLSTGGTGKTPHIEYLVQLLQYRYQVATMSRGYKRYTKGFLVAGPDANALKIGDEPMQYVMKFPELVVSVAEERLTGIPALLQRRPDIDVILLDDAYQHRSVKPGLNILITDYSRPFYQDYILPFGNLREGRGSSKRADMIVVSKCPASLTVQQAAEMRGRIAPQPHQQVFFTTIAYGAPYDIFTRTPVELNNRNIVLVCGIARPEPLIAYVEELAQSVHPLTYRDHHYFVTSDLEEIKAAFDNWSVDNKIILTTEKDAARLHLHAEKLAGWGVTIAVMPVQVQVLFEQGPAFDGIVMNFTERTIAENNPEPENPPEDDEPPVS